MHNIVKISFYMEKDKDDALLKVRSSRVCIAAGYKLYIGNFRTIFRRTWVIALLYAILYGLYTSMIIKEYPHFFIAVTTGHLYIPDHTVLNVFAFIAPFLILIVTIWFYSQFFSMLYQHRTQGIITAPPRIFCVSTDKRILRHTIICALTCLLLNIIIFAVIIGGTTYSGIKQSLAGLSLVALLCLLFIILAVPLSYPFMHYLTTRDSHFLKVLSHDYRMGFRQWGLLFTVAIITIILSVAFLVLTSLPANILFLANFKAQTGVLMGDPLGMPAYITKLTFLVFTLASFIQAYVIPSIFFPAYYAAGSIEAQEKERQNINEKS